MMPTLTDYPPDAPVAEASDVPRSVRPARSASRVRRTARVAALVAAPAAALAAAWWATRAPAPAAAPAAHDHAAMARADDAAGGRPVALTPDQARRIGVTFAAVTVDSLPRRIRTAGQVVVDETRLRTMSPKFDGWVERLYVDFTGRAVRRGEPLMAVYSPMLVTAQEELLLARRLANDVAAGAPDTRAGADDLVASARRRLAYWDVPADEIAEIERSGQVRRTLTMRASAQGVVVEKNVIAGQRVMAGDALFRVADLGTVWIEGNVYEQDLRVLRVGLPAVAEFEAFPGERWTGRIAYVYPTLDPETRTARVRIAVANPGLRLRPGMYATLHVEGAAGTATLTVPRGAVLATGERSLVFVRRADGRLEPRIVTVGATSDDRVEIVRGVAAGDTVVASATFLLDAESNLGAAMGGMGDMPGMDMTAPTAGPAARIARPER